MTSVSYSAQDYELMAKGFQFKQPAQATDFTKLSDPELVGALYGTARVLGLVVYYYDKGFRLAPELKGVVTPKAVETGLAEVEARAQKGSALCTEFVKGFNQEATRQKLPSNADALTQITPTVPLQNFVPPPAGVAVTHG